MGLALPIVRTFPSYQIHHIEKKDWRVLGQAGDSEPMCCIAAEGKQHSSKGDMNFIEHTFEQNAKQNLKIYAECFSVLDKGIRFKSICG